MKIVNAKNTLKVFVRNAHCWNVFSVSQTALAQEATINTGSGTSAYQVNQPEYSG